MLGAVIHPKNYILPLLRPHFCGRFPEENFMIYDAVHQAVLLQEDHKARPVSYTHLKGICIIKIVGEICFAVVAAEGKGVVILRHRAAHHSLRQQSLCRRVRGQHACHGSCCRLAKGTSFYGLHLPAPIKASA